MINILMDITADLYILADIVILTISRRRLILPFCEILKKTKVSFAGVFNKSKIVKLGFLSRIY